MNIIEKNPLKIKPGKLPSEKQLSEDIKTDLLEHELHKGIATECVYYFARKKFTYTHQFNKD